MSVVSFYMKYGAYEKVVSVQVLEPLSEAQTRYFSSRLSGCMSDCMRSLRDLDSSGGAGK